MSDPTIRVTRYEVTCLPEDDLDSHSWTVEVEYRGHDRWAVIARFRCLSTSGEWDREPQPSSRTPEWLATHRFEHDEALKRAAEVAPHVTVNGLTPAQYLAWRAGQETQ